MKVGNRKKGLGLLIFLAVYAGTSALVMLLWNALIPNIIGWIAINYWQAAGLLLLCRLLLGGFGKFFQAAPFLGNARAWKHVDHKKVMDFHERMENMSPNERREYIKNRMRGFDKDFGNQSFSRFEKDDEKTREDKD